MLQLRPYQRQALDCTYEWFCNNNGSCLVVLPTGSGKSLVMAYLIKEALEQWPDQRILVVTHVKELIEQNHAELLRLWPEAPAGIYSSGIGLRQHQARVLFAGIQSIHRKPELIGHADLILIDEAHLISGRSTSMYRNFIAAMEKINPMVKCLGLTATHYRLDQGYLDGGDNALFDGVSYEINVGELVDDGYLAPLTSKYPMTQLDTSGVGTRGGEFIAGELDKAVRPATEAAVKEVVDYGGGRKSWLLFGVTVDHCIQIKEALWKHGVNASAIFGNTPKYERNRSIEAFRNGYYQALVSCGVLTTGFNVPQVDLIALLRPTKSTGLYVQMCGRGSRNAPGKENCLVLDFAGNIFRHGPIDDVKPRQPGQRDEPGEAPVKPCPMCREIIAAAWRACPECGHEFPPPDPKIEEHASYLRIMNGSMKPEWFTVDDVSYSKYQAHGSPGMRIVYSCNGHKFSQWLKPRSRDGSRFQFARWWQERFGDAAKPYDADELLGMTDEIPVPKKISVRRKASKKGFVVVKCEFGELV